MSEWIEWNGGECPISSTAFIKARCGVEWKEVRPEGLAWYHGFKLGDTVICDTHPMDIVAYRLSKANGDKDE